MIRALARSIALSDAREPLQHDVDRAVALIDAARRCTVGLVEAE